MYRRSRRSVRILRNGAWAAAVVAIFGGMFGIGSERWPIAEAGGGLLVLAAALAGAAELRSRMPEPILDMARVLTVSEPPPTSPYGPCVVEVSVSAGLLPVSRVVVVREEHAPVAKWPRPGERVPVEITRRGDTRPVRIRWDAMSRHGGSSTRPNPFTYT